MVEPDFNESHIQQHVNTALISWAINESGAYPYFFIPTLIEENVLGWDTGYNFPWLGMPANTEHEGCNFFIQYKLSKRLESSGAGQYSDWGSPYLRFQIPHIKKDQQGHQYQDFHQWDALKSLSDDGYLVYYATNNVTDRETLHEIASRGTLLDETPFLDVSDVHSRHRYVTFTESSSHFYLHSEAVECNKSYWKSLSNILLESKQYKLKYDNKRLFDRLMLLLPESKVVAMFYEQYKGISKRFRDDSPNIEFVRFILLRNALRNIFDINLLRFAGGKQ